MSFLGSLIRLRILPLTICFSFLLLSVKLYDLVRGGDELSRMLIAGEAIAVTPEASDESLTEPEDEANEQAEAVDAVDPESVTELPEGESLGTNDGEGQTEEPSDPIDRFLQSKDAKLRFTKIELDILQSLSDRRKELVKWEEEVRMKENLLEATELRLDKKIGEINTLEKNVRELLLQYDKQEDAKIRSLVKIYENMKPKQAARIFDEMELPILLLVVDKMSERKAAPVLAKMDPMKAKQLTVELAEQRKLLSQSRQALDE